MTISRISMCVATGLVALLAGACVSVEEEGETDTAEHAIRDISSCFKQKTSEASESLEAAGYTRTSSMKYEVVYYQWYGSNYWKEVEAHRYEKGSSVAYATCKGVVGSPLPSTTSASLAGQMYGYGTSWPNPNADWTDPRPAQASVIWKDFRLARLGGAAELVVHVRTDDFVTRTTGAPIVSRMDQELVLSKNGDEWKNTGKLVSLELADGAIRAATITTRPPAYDRYDPAGKKLGRRGQFRYAAPDAEEASTEARTITLVDLPAASGVRAVPDRLTFSASESGAITIRNASSFPIRYSAPSMTPGTFLPNETVTTSVGLPAILSFETGDDEAVTVDLELAP